MAHFLTKLRKFSGEKTFKSIDFLQENVKNKDFSTGKKILQENEKNSYFWSKARFKNWLFKILQYYSLLNS